MGKRHERENQVFSSSAEKKKKTAASTAAPGNIFSVRKLDEYNECTLCINSILFLHPRSNES